MKFSISKDLFVKTLQKIQTVIPTHAPQAVVYNVLLACERDRLCITATDTNITMKCEIAAVVKKKGESTVPGRYLFNIVRELPEQDVDIEVDEKDVFHVRCGAASCKIFGMPAESFPVMPDFEKGKAIIMDMGSFKEMLKKTVYAASIEDSRRILNGVLISLKDQKIAVVATDGRRLALIEQELELGGNSGKDAVLPLKMVVELIKSLENEGNVAIQLDPKKAGFETEGLKVVSNLLEGDYPNYRQVIPTQYEERITVEREALLAALRRVSLFTEPKSPRVKIKFGDNQIQISATSPDVGEANESVAVKYSGKTVTAAFNPEFLMDPLRNLVEDEIFMELVDDISPLVIKSSTPFLYVLMPLRGE